MRKWMFKHTQTIHKQRFSVRSSVVSAFSSDNSDNNMIDCNHHCTVNGVILLLPARWFAIPRC